MRHTPIKVTFILDGTGMYYDPNEPPMLDGLDYLMQGNLHGRFNGTPPQRDEPPIEQRLSFLRSIIDGQRVYHASALFPEGTQVSDLLYIRKKFQSNRIESTHGSPNLQNATYREYNMPYPKVLCHKLVGYAVVIGYSVTERNPNRRSAVGEFRRDLKRFFRNIGKKRAVGLGNVVDVLIDRIDDDFSLVKDGHAMRYLPDPNGWRICRVRPPYWNIVNAVNVCEIGDEHKLIDVQCECFPCD